MTSKAPTDTTKEPSATLAAKRLRQAVASLTARVTRHGVPLPIGPLSEIVEVADWLESTPADESLKALEAVEHTAVEQDRAKDGLWLPSPIHQGKFIEYTEFSKAFRKLITQATAAQGEPKEMRATK